MDLNPVEPKILLATVAWKRHDLLKRFIVHHQKLGLDILIVGSEGPLLQDLCDQYDCEYIDFTNERKQFMHKLNKRVDYFLENEQYTHVLFMGSDDFMDKRLFDYMKTLITPTNVVSWSDIYVYCNMRKEMIHLTDMPKPRKGEPFAPGRCMSRAAVEKLNGFLWLNKKGEPAGRYPDASLWGRIKKNIDPNDIVIASSEKSSGGFLVDIKTGVNLNGYPKVKRNAAPPVHEILEGSLIDQVKEIMSVTPEPETTIEIGEKSIVDFEADIGPRTNIGEYTIIGNRVKIGKNCKIGNHVIIENGVEIGPGTVINNFVELKPGTEKIKIGKGCLIDSRVMIEGNCIIGDRSIVGPSCEIKSGVVLEEGVQLQGRNRLANNCYVEQGALIKYGSILTSNVRIGKDCFIGPNVIMTGDDTSRSQSEAGNQLSTSIGARTFVGASTIFMPSVHVGEDCLIGASSFVRDNTNNNEVWFGNPAKLRRKKEDT